MNARVVRVLQAYSAKRDIIEEPGVKVISHV